MSNHPLKTFCDNNDLTVTSVFVPQSKSRFPIDPKKFKFSDLQLNWKVTLLHKGREIITTDYSAGVAHCPSYPGGMAYITLSARECCKEECERGFNCTDSPSGDVFTGKTKILPDPLDVIACLAMDTGVINYIQFGDWAVDFGYDPDSIKARKIYDECLQYALTMRAGLGSKLFEELLEASANY